MSPRRSTATLGMNRKNVLAPSGSQVAAWARVGATVLPVTPIWYQRGAAFPLRSARRTVWVSQRDSTPPMLLYWFCAIARIGSVSRLLAGVKAFGTLALGHPVAEFGLSGPVKVEVDGRS